MDKTVVILSEQFQERFGGIVRLYGMQGAAAIASAHLVVIGVGGVGSWIVEALVRSGIGELTLIDPDDVALSNCNRQLQALTDTVGQSKIAVLAQRAQQINPQIQLHLVEDLVTHANLQTILPAADLWIDAIDSVKSKAAIIAYAIRHKQAIITTGGAGGRIDPQQVTMTDLSRTYNDALAAKVRATLRHDYHFSRNTKRKFGVDCIFSTEQPRYPAENGTTTMCKPGVPGTTLDCAMGYGAIATVTATFANIAVARALQRIITMSKRDE